MNPQPPPSSLTASISSILTLFQLKIDGVILRVNDAEEAGIAEALRTAAAIEDLPIQENADLVAVTDLEFLYLVAVGVDVSARVQDVRARLRLQTLRKIALKRDPRVRGIAISLEHDKAWRFGFDILPLDRGALGGASGRSRFRASAS